MEWLSRMLLRMGKKRTAAVADTLNHLVLQGLRENNLKNLSVAIPHDSLVCITGLSGSGKSSLAFDTVYAEGQRRYIETFSPYTRQFLDKIKKPEVDYVQNVRPAIAIQQKTRILNSRSTVGSLTNSNDYLRTLWTHIASPNCPECDRQIISHTANELALQLERACNDQPGEAFYICAPVTLPKSPKKRKALLEHITAIGYSRFLNPATMQAEITERPDKPPLWLHNEVIVVLDRIHAERFSYKSALDSFTQAYALAQGQCIILPRSIVTGSVAFPLKEYTHFQQLRCVDHPDAILPKIRKSLFSYNHPNGACENCNGFGFNLTVDPELVVPNPGLSLQEGAIHCWSSENRIWEHESLLLFCKKKKIPISKPWHTLTPAQQSLLFDTKEKTYTGIRPWFKKLERKSYKMHIRVFLARYRSQTICADCNGMRLKKEALIYKYKSVQLPDLWSMEIQKLLEWLTQTKKTLSKTQQVSRPLADLFAHTIERLTFLNDLGLSYLTLNRQARTLSGGETQRVNLAAALGSSLTATQFVLDEPSVGLHARDTLRLIAAVKQLSAGKSSVLVVEHDPEFIKAADSIIEIGPGAGSSGGEIVYTGSYARWKNKKSIYLQRKKQPAISNKKTKQIQIKNACARNLQNISCSIPLGSLTVLSGVSGSGKSTLVAEVILEAYRCYKQKVPATLIPGTVTGFEHIEECAYIDQSPLAKSPRANVATYTKIWDILRDLLAETEQAHQRALTRSSFSFNVDQGRCTVCKGAGHTREDMQFLSDIYLPCEACLGRRFQMPVLEVKRNGKNAHEWLQTTVSETALLLKENSRITATCQLLIRLGLGHLTLGHALSDLSGGEAQRLKLIRFIDAAKIKSSLLIFDEPTTGLHAQDVGLFLDLLDTLKAQGHTLICIEHNLDVIDSADHIIDLGPEGGSQGGRLLYDGPVAGLPAAQESYTALALERHKKSPESKQQKIKPAKKTSTSVARITGATQHNLKNISLAIPLEKIVAFTGVSGSGKSSVAKDILFAEGQRRYLDCLSPYARQFIKGLDKPAVESLDNIPPGVYVGQHLTLPVQLSTVATLSEIYNFLRLLFVKTGDQFCPEHPDQRIANLSADRIAATLHADYNEKIRILVPIITSRKGSHKEIIRRAIDADITEVRVNGVFCKSSSLFEGLERNKTHTIEYVLAVCNPRRLDTILLKEVLEHGLALGSGSIIINNAKKDLIFSTSRSCPICNRGFLKPDPEDLSFHSTRGACTVCSGTGVRQNGSLCKTCSGQRLNPIGRNIRIAGKNISELSSMKPLAALNFLNDTTFEKTTADLILSEVRTKLETLSSLGLNHISLDRDCKTLSSGELQRVRLSAALGSSLAGVLYLLDEPSAGLHPNDNRLVLNKIQQLKEHGSSVILIEHDPDSITCADHIVELGPGGGLEGGSVVFEGSLARFKKSDTKTSRAIKNSTSLSIKQVSRAIQESLTITQGTCNTVSIDSLTIPLNQLVAICGVSGAGKSSLVEGMVADTILNGTAPIAHNHWYGENSEVHASTAIHKILVIDQQPIGKNTRSTPASYLGLWDHIRKLFAQTPEAKSLGWSSSYFSYNTGNGRCPTCEGRGSLKLEMNFLANSSITCDTCEGKRFADEANTVRFTGLTPADALSLTFEEAKTHFTNYPKIRKPVDRACALGLGYLTLGQSSTTLSGGEAQRLKLVAELCTKQSDHTLYILDEPTTGLHVDDVSRLVQVLDELVDLGNSVFVIEHDPFVLAAADYILELGPGPGDQGGTVIFEGSPTELCRSTSPWGVIFKRSMQK